MKNQDALRGAHWLVLVIGLCATLLAWESARRDSVKILQEEFDYRVHQVVGRIERRFQESGMILRGSAGLFGASKEVTRSEFSTYVDSLHPLKNYPGVNSIGVGRWVTAKNKAKFLKQQHLNKLPQYDIWPKGERDEYAPVIFLEPENPQNLRTFGFDMFYDVTRRAAMQEARDSDEPALTGALKLISDPEEKSHIAFIMYAPVFAGGAQHKTLEQRRANLFGWVYLTFRIEETVHGILGESAGTFEESVAISIFEGGVPSLEKMVYRSSTKNSENDEKNEALFQTTVSATLVNKPFTLQMHSLPLFDSRLNKNKGWAVLIGGISLSSLFSLLVWILVHGRKRAVIIARKMNQELIGREKRFRQMFEDNASIAYIVDPDNGKIIDANTVAANFWGYTLEEIRQMNIAEINLAGQDEIQTSLKLQIADRNPGLYTFRHKLKNGEIRHVEIYRSLLTNNDKSSIYCIAHDVTGRKEAEKALSESQSKLQAIIETAMDAVVQMNSEGVVTDWNTRAERAFGWTREEVIGKVLIDCIIPAQHQMVYLDGMKQFLDDDDSLVRHSQFEIEARHRDGREFPIEVAVTTMVSSSGEHEYCAFMHDITNRKKNESALRKARLELENRIFERTAELVRTNRRLNAEIAERTNAQDALQRSEEMLRQLVAHQDRIRENERKRIAREIHDDLGQHLLVLRIDVSMLLRTENELPKLGERVDSILRHIDATMRSVRAIINNLRPSVLDLGLHAALEWQAEEFQRRSGIACELEVDDDELDLEDNVATVLFRILQEALTNVLRHAKASRIQIKLGRENDRLVMTIADNGIGMQQAKKSEQNSFGLVGIRERISILGGELNVESDTSGTVLTVSLPILDS